MDKVNKQIFNINWDTKLPNYEIKNFNYDTNKIFENNVGIIIDNGSYECRAGWSFSSEPNIRFRSIVGKPKVQAKGQEHLFLVGNEMLSIDQGKLHKKSPFEKNYVTHFGTQEHLLDHIFSNLNINSTSVSVDHPIIFTEPICNLNWSRKNISELMFELYSVPSLCYGVDMLFSHDYNVNLNKEKNKNSFTNRENCLIISSSFQTTHIVPVINGRVNLDKTRRIGIGAFHGNELLTKSLNLRYTDIRAKFTSELVQDIQEKYTMCAIDYKSQVRLLQSLFEHDQNALKEDEKKRMFGSLEMYEKANSEELLQKRLQDNKYKHLKVYRNLIEYENEQLIKDDQENNLIKDLIFFDMPRAGNEILITEDEMRRKGDVRKEQSRRLRELMQKKREENMRTLEKELNELELISQMKSSAIDIYQFEEALMSSGYTSYEELQKRMNKIFMKINFNKETKDNNNNNNTTTMDEKLDEEKRWPLLSILDEDLTDEQIKMKKIHKMQRQAYINRLEKRERLKKEKERVEELKQKDPECYLVNLYRRKKDFVDRMEKYKGARRDITSRYSKANRGRMMVLAELGKEAKEGKKGENVNDDFGMNDDDWEVYRGISRHNLSEDEEEDQHQLQEIEAQIIENDPNYFKYTDDITQSLFFSTQHLCLGVDQFRGAELLFQPFMIGVDQAGLSEIILSIFKTMTKEEQRLLAGNIFLTGGFTKTANLKERLFRDLRENLNCDIEINITLADDPELDAWKGARRFYNQDDSRKFFITKEEYNECGYDYFKEHLCSNNSINYRGSGFSYDISNKKQKII